MNYVKEAETLLKQYGKLHTALENIRARKWKLIESGKPQEIKGFDTTKPYTSGGYINDTFKQCLEIVELNREEKQTEETIQDIQGVINQLDELDREIITLWYVKRESKEKIADALNVQSTTTVYNQKNKAVAAFAVLYFGAGALSAI